MKEMALLFQSRSYNELDHNEYDHLLVTAIVGWTQGHASTRSEYLVDAKFAKAHFQEKINHRRAAKRPLFAEESVGRTIRRDMYDAAEMMMKKDRIVS